MATLSPPLTWSTNSSSPAALLHPLIPLTHLALEPPHSAPLAPPGFFCWFLFSPTSWPNTHSSVPSPPVSPHPLGFSPNFTALWMPEMLQYTPSALASLLNSSLANSAAPGQFHWMSMQTSQKANIPQNELLLAPKACFIIKTLPSKFMATLFLQFTQDRNLRGILNCSPIQKVATALCVSEPLRSILHTASARPQSRSQTMHSSAQDPEMVSILPTQQRPESLSWTAPHSHLSTLSSHSTHPLSLATLDALAVFTPTWGSSL